MSKKAGKMTVVYGNVVEGLGYIRELEWFKTYLTYYKNMLNEKPWMLGNEKSLTQEMRSISQKIESHIKTMQVLGAGRHYKYSTLLVEAQTLLNNKIGSVIKKSLRSKILRLNNKEQLPTEVFSDKVSDFANILSDLILGLNKIRELELEHQKESKTNDVEKER